MAGARELLDYVEAATDLDVLAITDHDDIRGAWEAREAWAKGRYRFEFVLGAEITAIEGHVLALFVQEPLPNLCPIVEVLEAVHRQGGLCVIPHPMNWLTRSVGRRTLLRVASVQRGGLLIDGMETANQSPGSRMWLRRAARLNREVLHAAEIGGSDAHFLEFIGSAYTAFPGRTAAELKQAIQSRTTAGRNGVHPGLRAIGAGPLIRQTCRGIMTTPRSMGLWPTTVSFVRRIFHAR